MKKKILTVLFLILITIPTLIPFINGRFFYTQDYIFIARLHQMSSALFSGQFPVRWSPDLRYGEPLFNFYAPGAYYLGALINFGGFNLIWTAKLLFMFSAFLSALTMYLLVKELFGQKAAYFAAILYTYAPYKAVDMYVRGSLSETWAFVFFPLIFYTSLLLAKQFNPKNLSFLAFSLTGLFLTHNVTAMMFLPFIALWWLYLIFSEKKIVLTLRFFLASLLAGGTASFFLLPAILERHLIQTKYLIVGYFNFRAHFVAIKQFFSLFWGYGSSLWGPDDGLSFQIGIVNLTVIGLAGLFGLIYRKNKKVLLFTLFLLISFIFSVFLQHNKSAFIWERVPIMAFIQFPWRFLGISIFIAALAGGWAASLLTDKLRPIYFLLIIGAILLSIGYFKPKDYVDESFFEKFLNVEMMHKGADLTKDYLPIWVKSTDEERFDLPKAEAGEIQIEDFKRGSNFLSFSLNSLSENKIELPLTYFPGWEVKIDSEVISQESPSRLGLIRFKIPEGGYKVSVEFKDTPVRKTANIISIISILFLITLLLRARFKRI